MATIHSLDYLGDEEGVTGGVTDNATAVGTYTPTGNIQNCIVIPAWNDTFSNGALVVLTASNTHVLDISDASDLSATISNLSSLSEAHDIIPMQKGYGGYFVSYLTGGVEKVSGYWGTIQFTATTEPASAAGGTMELVSKAKFPTFYLGFRVTAGAGNHQLALYFADLDRAVSGSANTLTKAGNWEFTATSHSSWSARPDGIFALSHLPLLGKKWGGDLVALFGSTTADGGFITPDSGGATNASLALLQSGIVIASHAPQSNNRETTGMVANQFGEIYITGQEDILSGTQKLLCKYVMTADGWSLDASIAWTGNAGTLGEDAANSDAADIRNPIWDGRHLIVFDYSDSSNYRQYTYDRDLTLVETFIVTSGTGAFRGGKASTAYYGESH